MKKMLSIILTIAMIFSLIGSVQPVWAENIAADLPEYDGIIVKFKEPQAMSLQSIPSPLSANSDVQVVDMVHTSESAYALIQPRSGDIQSTIDTLENLDEVEFAEPNYKIYANAVDAQFSTNLHAVNVSQAWNRVYPTDAEDILVAVLDTGIDISHPDLADNIYHNEQEDAGRTGTDEDGNGFIDDKTGWDFLHGDNTVYDDLKDSTGQDEDTHGTHVAGILAGVQNGSGIQGIAYDNVKILPIKFLAGEDGGWTMDAIRGIQYAEMMGADIVNCSWGSSGYSRALEYEIATSDMLFVCAAGNDSFNTANIPQYPACLDCDNIISVAALNDNLDIATFSNFGPDIDLAAPGTNINSCIPKGGYARFDGTSMAAPVVSGAAALMMLYDQDITTEEIKQGFIGSLTPLPNPIDNIYPNGYLNINGALNYLQEISDMPVMQARYGGATFQSDDAVYFIGGSNDQGYVTQASKYSKQTGLWTTMELSQQLMLAAFCETAEAGYILGGKSADGALDTVYQFDKNSETLELQEVHLPAVLYGAAAAICNNELYVIGGVGEDGYVQTVYRSPLGSLHFTAIANLPAPLGYAQAEAVGGSIYVFGGSNAEGCNRSTYRFDTATGAWSGCANMVNNHNYGTSLELDGKLYMFGGMNHFSQDGSVVFPQEGNQLFSSLTDTVEEYDPATNTWTELMKLPTAKAGFGIAAVNRYYMICGGWNGVTLSETQRYNGLTAPVSVMHQTIGDGTDPHTRQVQVKWQPLTWADAYDVELDGVVHRVYGAEYICTVDMGTQHAYRVRAVTENGTARWSSMGHINSYAEIKDAKPIPLNDSDEDYILEEDGEVWYRIPQEYMGLITLQLSEVPDGCMYSFDIYNTYGEFIMTNYITDEVAHIDNFALNGYDYYVRVFSQRGYSTDTPFKLTTVFEDGAYEGVVPAHVKANKLDWVSYSIGDDVEELENHVSVYTPEIGIDQEQMPAEPQAELQAQTRAMTIIPLDGKVTGAIGQASPVATYSLGNCGYNGRQTLVLVPPEGYEYCINIYKVKDNSWLAGGWTDYLDNGRKICVLDWVNGANENTGVYVKVFSPYKQYGGAFELYRYSSHEGRTYEANQGFKQALEKELNPVQGYSNYQRNYMGGYDDFKEPLKNLTLDFEYDVDMYVFDADAGDKVTISLEVLDEYVNGVVDNSGAEDYEILVKSDYQVQQQMTDYTLYSYKVFRYDNAINPHVSKDRKTKFVTYIVEKSGMNYIEVRRKNPFRMPGNIPKKWMEYNLTATLTNQRLIGEEEIVRPGITNDFTMVADEINAPGLLDVIAPGLPDGKDSVSGTIDNQLDVDWYHINSPEAITKYFDLEGMGTIVVYDAKNQRYNLGKSIVYPFEANQDYFVGVFFNETKSKFNGKPKEYTLSFMDVNETNMIFTPVLDEETWTGTFLYDNNPELILEEDLADAATNPRFLLTADEMTGYVDIGTAHTIPKILARPVYYDILLSNNTSETATVHVEDIGFQLADDGTSDDLIHKNWACLEAWSDYLGMSWTSDDLLYNEGRVSKEPIFLKGHTAHSIKNQMGESGVITIPPGQSKWLFGDALRPAITAAVVEETADRIIFNMAARIKIEGEINVNSAIFHNAENIGNPAPGKLITSSDGRTYSGGFEENDIGTKVKGISSSLAEVKTEVTWRIDDKEYFTPTVYNMKNPDGFWVQLNNKGWVTHLNVNSNATTMDTGAESSTLGFEYTDDVKTWYLDSRHYSPTVGNNAVPSNNTVFPIPNACDLGNYGVKVNYTVNLENTTDENKTVIYEVRTPAPIIVYYTVRDAQGRIIGQDSKVKIPTTITPEDPNTQDRDLDVEYPWDYPFKLLTVDINKGEKKRLDVTVILPNASTGGWHNFMRAVPQGSITE